ncbi:hypothetical protein [Salinispora cortesiana]|uniref:hypothetical protein n=1 Tax=Salinispora cortesiana TaxID=1305843 RepID=UPI00041EC0BA|nr:hypothetical protein [Salinispora cortesiana]
MSSERPVASGGYDPATGDRPRPGLRAIARDRRVWVILGVVAAVLVCCCASAAGTLFALAAGLFTAG